MEVPSSIGLTKSQVQVHCCYIGAHPSLALHVPRDLIQTLQLILQHYCRPIIYIIFTFATTILHFPRQFHRFVCWFVCQFICRFASSLASSPMIRLRNRERLQVCLSLNLAVEHGFWCARILFAHIPRLSISLQLINTFPLHRHQPHSYSHQTTIY